MLLRAIRATHPLLYRPSASIVIYLRDHNRHITPQKSKTNLSYKNPTKIHPDAPVQPFIEYKLEPEMQELLNRQVFEQYKNKLLRGIVDKEKQKEPDPLWGEEEPPIHYFNNISRTDLMRVSHPQNLDTLHLVEEHYNPHFATQFSGQITVESVLNSDVHQLVQLTLAARNQGVEDMALWYAIENGFQRGKKLYLLSPEELVRLKWAFDGKLKQGTPVFHQILSSLLREDLPKLSKDLLLDLFYACGYSNPGKTNLQTDILDLLKHSFRNFSFEEKVHFLLTFTHLCKPLKHATKLIKRRRYEFKQKAAGLILQLDLWDLQLTNETVQQLVYSLAKLQVQNTKFITLPLRQYIENNLDSYCQDLQRLFQAIAYLPQLEAGEGVMGQELAGKLRELAVARWDQFSKIQQIRIIHSLWNLGLMDEALLELYKAIEFQADSTLLYYACQLELSTSSQREWQIIHCLAQIQYLPLPYFLSYKRFYNYIKATTEWKLKPVEDKLRNTQYYYSALRQEDSLLRVKTYRKMKEFQKFAEMSFSQNGGAPVANLELCHFGYPIHQVSLDIVSKRDFIPGTTQLKQTYMNKVRSLKNVGWKHLAFTEKQMESISLGSGIQHIQKCFEGHEQEQKAVMDYQEYKQAEKIEFQKMIESMRSWDLDSINGFMAELQGQEDIKLGDDLNDLETIEKNQELMDQIRKSEEEGDAPKKKKK